MNPHNGNDANKDGAPCTRRHPRIVRVLKWCFRGILLVIMPSTAVLIWGHVPLVHMYDAAYSAVELGDRSDHVVELFGPPHEIRPPLQNGEVVLYVYRVYPLLLGENPHVRTQWRIGIDGSNRVVSRHRSDGPC